MTQFYQQKNKILKNLAILKNMVLLQQNIHLFEKYLYEIHDIAINLEVSTTSPIVQNYLLDFKQFYKDILKLWESMQVYYEDIVEAMWEYTHKWFKKNFSEHFE